MKLKTVLNRHPCSALRLIAASTLALGSLAAGPNSELLAQMPTFRSSSERRTWLEDERQLPRQRERATHRGLEINTGPISVIGANDFDARDAAERASAAWNQAAALADRFTEIHRQPNFAQGAVQIVLGDLGADAESPSKPTVAPIGRVAQVIVSSDREDADPDQQQKELSQSVALAFFRVAELDESLPAWVSQGLAAYVAGIRPGEESPDEPAARIAFLLEGNDGRHAGPFFELIRHELNVAQPDVERQFHLSRDAESELPGGSESVERFFSELAADYESWQRDPLSGQPELAAGEDRDPNLRDVKAELAFALKLADRFGAEATAGIRTKVTTFDRQRGMATAVTHQSAAQPPSLAALLSRITAADRPSWATVGPDGRLVWSDESETLSELLGVEERRYRYVWGADKWVLETTLADGRKLQGRLDPNPDDAHRPLAKFSIVAAN